MDAMAHRLTQYARGGGCACKIPPGELEDMVRGLTGVPPRAAAGELLVGLEDGDDAAVVRIENGIALIATTDFFTPVVDDAYDWGRIAATNALSDVYAMGGRPVVAVNLLGWPRDQLPFELAAETLRGGRDVCAEAGCHLAGGHSVDDREPKYGLAVTGIGDPDRLLRNDSGKPGVPLSLTKPLGVGVLNSRHKATGERFAHAIETMKPPGARYGAIIVVAQTVSYDLVQTNAISTGALKRLWTSCRWSARGCTRYSPCVPSRCRPSRLIASIWSGHGSISVTSSPARARCPPM